MTTSVSTTTTTACPTIAITRAGDPIIGVCNTTAGGPTGGVNCSFSVSAEMPPSAIDNTTSIKYFNYASSSSVNSANQGYGINTGFYVTPSMSNASVACGLLFATANDMPDRDSSWTLIYSGPTGISPTVDPGRLVYVAQQNFSNGIAYAHYRLLVISKRNTNNAVQYSEAQIMGYF